MLGFEVSPVVQYVIAFAIIAILLALFAIVLKRIGGKRFAMGGERGRGRQPRLGIVDVYDLDRQRQLVLLRRDNVEHLVMLGGPNDCVIESNIVRAPHGRAMAPPAMEVPFEPAPEQAITGQPGYQPGLSQGSPPQAAAPIAAAAMVQPAAQPPPAASTGAPPAQAEPPPPPGFAPQPRRNAVPQPEMEPPAQQGLSQAMEPVVAQPAQKRAAEPGAESRRGLFGFGRQAQTRPAEKPAPQFPPRPRTTPVAPDNPPPYPPRSRTTPNLPDAPSDSAGEAPSHAAVGGGMDATRLSGAGLAAAGADDALTRAGGEAVPSPASAPEAAPAAPAAREDALFSDMARELEAAFKRPAPAAPADARSARVTPSPDAPVDTRGDDAPAPEAPVFISSEPPAFPARTAPPVAEAPRRQSEDAFSIEQAFAEAVPSRREAAGSAIDRSPIDDSPLVESALAESPLAESALAESALAESSSTGTAPEITAPETAPVTGDGSDDHAPAGSPHAPAPGMTPAPTSGPAHFASAIEESPQPQAPPRADVQTDTQDPDPRFPETEEPAASPAFAQAQAIIAEEALAEAAEAEAAPEGAAHTHARSVDDVASHAQPGSETAPEPELTADADTTEPAIEEEPAAHPATGAFAPQDTVRAKRDTTVQDGVTEEPAAQASADEASADEAPADEASADEAPAAEEANTADQPQAEPAPKEEKPGGKVDPFSVDEIEAEFARLLGRSTDKGPKSS